MGRNGGTDNCIIVWQRIEGERIRVGKIGRL
jgi:hypothetical protein